MTNSGSVLAWKHIYPGIQIPLLLKYIEDRDCHFNKIPDAKVALLWLDTHPFEFGLWNAFLKFDQTVWHKIIETNGSMLKKYKSMIRKAASQSVETKLSDYPAAFCFATEEIASDIASELSQRVNGIGMALVLQSDGSIKVSLRSNEGLNMIPIAQALGGNGHAYAAAFKCTPDKLRDLLAGKDLLAEPSFGFAI